MGTGNWTQIWNACTTSTYRLSHLHSSPKKLLVGMEPQNIKRYHTKRGVKLGRSLGWRDGSVVRHIGCSCRPPKLGSWHSCGNSQLTTWNSSSRGCDTFFGPLWVLPYTQAKGSYAENTHPEVSIIGWSATAVSVLFSLPDSIIRLSQRVLRKTSFLLGSRSWGEAQEDFPEASAFSRHGPFPLGFSVLSSTTPLSWVLLSYFVSV